MTRGTTSTARKTGPVHRSDTKARISDAKARIMSKAAELFAERGYDGVGISEVGDAVGLGKGALYYHIGSKENLLFEIITDYMVELNEVAQGILDTARSQRSCILDLSYGFFDTMVRSRSEMTVCFREVHALTEERRNAVLSMHANYQAIWLKALQKGELSGEFRAISKIEIKALLGMYFYSFLWVRPHGKSSIHSLAESFSSLVIRAVEKPPLSVAR